MILNIRFVCGDAFLFLCIDKIFTKNYTVNREVIIMAQTLVNVRMDEEVKRSMEETCKELGITMSTAFNIFARKMSREKRIPF